MTGTTVPPPPPAPGQPAAAPAKPPPFQAVPDPALDDLLLRLDAADAQVKEAKQQRDAIDAMVKARLTAQLPRDAAGRPVTGTVDVPAGRYRAARRLSWQARRNFNRKRFEADYPGVIDRYLEWGAGFWGWKDVSG